MEHETDDFRDEVRGHVAPLPPGGLADVIQGHLLLVLAIALLQQLLLPVGVEGDLNACIVHGAGEQQDAEARVPRQVRQGQSVQHHRHDGGCVMQLKSPHCTAG